MLSAAAAAFVLSLLVAIAAALVLGIAHGLLLLSTMLEVQRIARADDLAGLTALLYAGAYVGFFIPAALGILSHWASYSLLFVVGAVVACACLTLVLRFSGHHLHPRLVAAHDAEVAQPAEVRR